MCKRKYHMAYYTLEQELCDRNYVMQPRDDKQDNTNQTVHTQLQFINIQH